MNANEELSLQGPGVNTDENKYREGFTSYAVETHSSVLLLCTKVMRLKYTITSFTSLHFGDNFNL